MTFVQGMLRNMVNNAYLQVQWNFNINKQNKTQNKRIEIFLFFEYISIKNN